MAEPGKLKHQKRYPNPIPEDVEQQGEEAVAAWLEAQAAAWKTERDIRVEKIEKDARLRSREKGVSLMHISKDLRLYICRMLDPVTMFMIYDADKVGGTTRFSDWCDTLNTNNYGIEECVWDYLLYHHYGNVADLDIQGLSVDQRRWKFYAHWLTDEGRGQTFFGSAGGRLNFFNVKTLPRDFMYSLNVDRRNDNIRCQAGSLVDLDESMDCAFTRRLKDQNIRVVTTGVDRYYVITPRYLGIMRRKFMVEVVMIMLSMEGITCYQPWPLDADLSDRNTEIVYIHATCIGCNSNATAFVCGGCEEVGYCGKECATKHWHQNGHKDSCGL